MIILAAALLFTLITLVSGAIPKLPGWTLAFGEDFAGSRGRLPNSDRWLIRTGHGTNGWGNGQVQMYTRNPANVQTTGLGTLSITPIRGRSGWTSGRIETKRSDFMAPAGGRMIIQARIAMASLYFALHRIPVAETRDVCIQTNSLKAWCHSPKWCWILACFLDAWVSACCLYMTLRLAADKY